MTVGRMNSHLQHTPDGTTEGFWILSLGGKTRSLYSALIYWPFALTVDYDCSPSPPLDMLKTHGVTHLPSGMAVVKYGLSRPGAMALIQRLRALDGDWSFTKPTSRKWLTIRDRVKEIVERYPRRTTP